MFNIVSNVYNSDSVIITIVDHLTGDEYFARVTQFDLKFFSLENFYNLIGQICELEQSGIKLPTQYKIQYRKVSTTNYLMQISIESLSIIEKIIFTETNQNNLPRFIPKISLGIFEDLEVYQKYPESNIQINYINSYLLTFPANTKCIYIPTGKAKTNTHDLCYKQINWTKLEQFYNLTQLEIPSRFFFGSAEKKLTLTNLLPEPKNNQEHINQLTWTNLMEKYYGSLLKIFNIGPHTKVTQLTLPNLKWLTLIGSANKCVFISTQPFLSKITIVKYYFDYKFPEEWTINNIDTDGANIGLKFICPEISLVNNISSSIKSILKAQCPELKTIEYKFYPGNSIRKEYYAFYENPSNIKMKKKHPCDLYLKKFRSAMEKYYGPLGLEVEISHCLFYPEDEN